MEIKPRKDKQPLNPWMSSALLVSRKRKDKLAKIKTRNPSLINVNKFKSYNSVYRSLIRKAKFNYYHEKFQEFSNDMKKTWKIINSIIATKKSSHDIPSTFYDGNMSYTGTKDIAEGFNEFFVNVGPSLAEVIPNTDVNYESYLSDPISETFIFANVTPAIVLNTLSRLKSKNSSGADNISTLLLKYIMPVIIMPITHLFNLSFKTGYIPLSYKCAKIIPVYKSGDKDKFTNYRPISILPAFSKLLEKMAALQMFKYINKFNILYEHQYGFRPKHDTNQPLLHFLDRIYKGLNKPTSEFTLAIFLDLKKAFDTCDHQILLRKMENYGFRGISNFWFKNYLSDRSQYVNIQNVNSTKQDIKCGVPQGSVLGPLLFLLYINDLPTATEFFTSLFADDTGFLLSSPNLEEIFLKANTELSKAATWFQANKLSLNVSKTKFIVFRNNKMVLDEQICKLKIGNEDIERIGNNCTDKYYKFVGIRMDEFLSWEHQTNHVSSKIASATFALNQVKNFLPQYIRKMIYNSLIRSHLEYGILTWGIKKSKNITKIITLQKKAVRNVAKRGYSSHTDPLFGMLGLLKFDDILINNARCLMYNYTNKLLPASFQGMFEPLTQFNRNMNYKVQRIKYESLSNFPSVFLPKIWNSLPLGCKSLQSQKMFKNALKEKAISDYKKFKCPKNNCYSCK